MEMVLVKRTTAKDGTGKKKVTGVKDGLEKSGAYPMDFGARVAELHLAMLDGRHDADIDRGLGLYSLHDKLIAGDLVGPGKGLIMSLSKDQKARPGLVTVDSRPTLQWSSDSIHKDARVPLYMDEFLQLDAQAFDLIFMDAECGPRLMSFGLRGLQDYLLNDFVSSSKPFDDLLAVDEAWKLGELVMSCQETVLQALDAIEKQAAYDDTEFQKRRAAAEAAAEKILQGKPDKPDRKDAVEKWLRGEIDRLVSQSRELKEKAGKAAEKAGCALYKVLGLVQKHGCSDDFSEKLELWRQMDAAQRAAYQVVHAAKDGTLQEPEPHHVVDATSAPEDTLLDSTQVDVPPMASQPDAALKLPDEAETLLLNAYVDVNGDDQAGYQNDSQEAHTGEGGGQSDSQEAHTREGGEQKDSKEAHTGEGVVQKDSEEAHTGEGGGQKEQKDSNEAHTGEGGGQNDTGSQSMPVRVGSSGAQANLGNAGLQELEKLATDDDDSVEIMNDDALLEAQLARMMLKEEPTEAPVPAPVEPAAADVVHPVQATALDASRTETTLPVPTTTTTPIAQVPVPTPATTPIAQVPVPATTTTPTPIAQVPVPTPATTPIAQVPVATPATTPIAEVPVATAATTPIAEVPVATPATTPIVEPVPPTTTPIPQVPVPATTTPDAQTDEKPSAEKLGQIQSVTAALQRLNTADIQAVATTGKADTKEQGPYVMADPYPPYPVAIVGAASEDGEDYDEEIAKLEAKKKAKRDRMKFNRSLESANCPDVVLKKAADGKYGTAVLKELFKIYMDSGMDWMNSSLVIEAKRKQQTSITGSQHYVTFEALKSKHGENRAKAVRDEKKALQRVHGNYQPDIPYWFKHPDWQNDEEMEMFLVYESARVESRRTDEINHKFEASMGLTGASVNQQHGDPGSERELAKLKNHGKQPKKQSVPNFAAKANCKIKDARSLLTDAKMWQHKVDETQQKKASDSTVSPEMCDGYRHQINFLVANLTEKIDALEAVVVKGAKDEKIITPGINEVQKAMEKYQTGMKTIREISYVAAQKVAHAAATEFQSLGVRPRQALLDLASAGAYGTHESNIERDVMRRSMEGTVPIHYIDVPVRARHPTTKEWKMPMILPHEICLYLYRHGSKHYGSDDCNAELKKFWGHFKKCTNKEAIKWPHVWEDTCTPIGLHGDDCRFTETGQKVVCLSINFLLDVAASLNYASYGIAPERWIGDPSIDPVAELNDIEPENRFPPTVLTELRGDWKFYKDEIRP
ncbi:spp-11 [Symbiodinium microadriaticum]|nr:spp-11 [Symbiodinium microadriaticum]